MLFTPIFARGAVKLAKLAFAWLGGSRQLSSVTVTFSLTFKTSKLECCVLSGGNIIGLTFRVVILRESLVAEDIMTWGKGVAASLTLGGVRVSMCSRSCWIRDLSPLLVLRLFLLCDKGVDWGLSPPVVSVSGPPSSSSDPL
jgi:hypothetical protein